MAIPLRKETRHPALRDVLRGKRPLHELLRGPLEELLSLSAAAVLLPNQPHVSTLWRWCLRGVKGVRLRTVFVGGRRYTTPAYLIEFISRLSGPTAEAPQPAASLRAEQTARAAERAEALF
jgi:hypothetical protein